VQRLGSLGSNGSCHPLLSPGTSPETDLAQKAWPPGEDVVHFQAPPPLRRPRMDTVTDDDARGLPGDTKWMTYTELGARLGIERLSAKRLAMRHRWPRRAGNDGAARVAVPVSVLDGRLRTKPENTGAGDSAPGQKLQNQALIARLRERIASLEGQLSGLKTALDARAADHKAEISRLEQRHREELDRLVKTHAAEIERLSTLRMHSVPAPPPKRSPFWWRIGRRGKAPSAG
jgi:hypothetical protein